MVSKSTTKESSKVWLMSTVLIAIPFEFRNKEYGRVRNKKKEYNERMDCWNDLVNYVAREGNALSSV